MARAQRAVVDENASTVVPARLIVILAHTARSPEAAISGSPAASCTQPCGRKRSENTKCMANPAAMGTA